MVPTMQGMDTTVSIDCHGLRCVRRLQRHGSRRQERGFSLIEVLIAILVLSIGLLGMVGMQFASLQSNRDARLQSTAADLAREMAEMMRGNKAVAVQSGTSNPYLGDYSSSPLAPSTTSYCLAVANHNCADNTEIARAELTEWLARVDAALPGARVVICRDDAPYDSSGKPQWACTNSGTSNPVNYIKIGWSRLSTDSTQTGTSRLLSATATTSRPWLIFPVTAGHAD